MSPASRATSWILVSLQPDFMRLQSRGPMTSSECLVPSRSLKNTTMSHDDRALPTEETDTAVAGLLGKACADADLRVTPFAPEEPPTEASRYQHSIHCCPRTVELSLSQTLEY